MAEPERQQPPNQVQNWAQSSPIVSRLLLIVTVACSIMGFLTGITILVLNIPSAVIFRFEVYRLVLAGFFENSLFAFLFGVLSYVTMGPVLESQHGSVRLLVLFATLSLLTAVSFDFVSLFLAYNPVLPIPEAMEYPSGGMWIVLLALMGIDAVENPDKPRRFLCLPMNVPNKYFPWLLILLLFLLGGVGVDLLLACVIGHLYGWGYLDRLKLSDDQVRTWEAGMLRSLAAQPGFVPLDMAGQGMGTGGEWGQEQREQQQQQSARNAGGGERGNIRTLRAGGGGGAVPPSTGDTTTGDDLEKGVFGGSGHVVGAKELTGTVSVATPASKSAAREAAARAAKARLAKKKATPTRASIPESPTVHDDDDDLLGPEGDRHGLQEAFGPDGDAWDEPAPPSSDEEAMRRLVEMGFDRSHARSALAQANGDVDAAAAILIQREL